MKDPSTFSSLLGERCLSMFFVLLFALVMSPSGLSRSGLQTENEEMKKLDFLIGEWKGKGWTYRPDGSRSRGDVSQNTIVEAQPDGTVRLKDKKSYDYQIPAPTQLARSETAVISYDEATRLFRWQLDGKRGTPSPGKLIESKTFQWERSISHSIYRFTIKVTESGEWHETMEFWLGNKDGWFKAQESVLKRTK